MGRMQREKGKRFERDIAGRLRDRWPDVVVRRASQAERADNPDVFSEGHPVLDLLWLELQDARAPTPYAKLEQAERDVDMFHEKRVHVPGITLRRLPFVVWHRIGERTIYVTSRMWALGALAKWTTPHDDRLSAPITMPFEHFIELVNRCAKRGGL